MEGNAVERAMKTETDTRTESKQWASLVGFCLRHKPWHPHHEKVSPGGCRLDERSKCTGHVVHFNIVIHKSYRLSLRANRRHFVKNKMTFNRRKWVKPNMLKSTPS